jgi:multidrug efflux pump
VVLENVFKKVEGGMPPREAGIRGSAEVYFAIIATTVALVAVFLPVIFLQGITGRLFKEFGIVLSGSVIISAFVALTLTPMMSSRILKQHQHHSKFYQKTEPFFRGMAEWYRSTLAAFLRRRGQAFAVIGVAFILILVVGMSLQSELAPLEDRSRMRISATGPEGATFEYMDAYMADLVRGIENAIPEREAIIAITSGGGGGSGGVNSGNVNLMLVPPEKRARSQQQIADQLSTLTRLTEARTFVTQDQAIGGRTRRLPVRLCCFN